MIDFTGMPVRNKTYAGANSSLRNKDCNKALKRIVPKINMDKINEIVGQTPFISEVQKQFYKTMLKKRKERILDYSLNELRKLNT